MNVGNISVTVVAGGSITLGLLAWWGIKKFGFTARWRDGKRLFDASVGSGKQDPGSVDISANTVKGSLKAKTAADSGRFNDNKVDGDLDVHFNTK